MPTSGVAVVTMAGGRNAQIITEAVNTGDHSALISPVDRGCRDISLASRGKPGGGRPFSRKSKRRRGKRGV